MAAAASTGRPRVNLIHSELFVANPGSLKICLFRAEFFIHRIASQNVHRGKFLDMFISCVHTFDEFIRYFRANL